jgi:dolichol-phosphate mannosyltransferase
MNKILSVVVPTYNERENIEILVPRILCVFREHSIDGEIVIVEDRSTDGSEEVLRQMQSELPEVRVLFREPPGSLSKAWHEGFLVADGEFVVCIDADLCHDPDYFPSMLRRMETCDLLIGSRYLEPGSQRMEDKSLAAKLCSRVGQISSRMVFGFTETDTSHSFRMFRRDLFERIANRLNQEGNVYLIQFLYEAKRAGARVAEMPIVYGKRIHGETKLNISRETMRYFRFVFRTLFSFRREGTGA